jgi:hypothetical protein
MADPNLNLPADSNAISDEIRRQLPWLMPSIASVPLPSAVQQDISAPVMGTPMQPQNPQSKLGKLRDILLSAAQGGLAGLGAQEQMAAASGGRRAGGVGVGFQAGYQLPFLRQFQQNQLQREQAQTQMAQAQAQYFPQMMMLGAQKDISQTKKNLAEAGKFGAEAGAVPIKAALEQAQTEAAYYKDDPNLGLIDLRTKQPVAGGGIGYAPLTDQEAALLGKQPGEQVPIKIKNTANEMVNRGIRNIQANGRSLIADNQGNVIKDMGAATPMAVLNAQIGGAGNPNDPAVQSMVDMVGQGRMDLPTALRTFWRQPALATNFTAALAAKYPNYNQMNFGISRDTLHYFTVGKGADELNAFRTAMLHADLLKQAAQALQNGDTRTLNSLKNRFKSEFGDPNLTNFNAISHVYQNEIQKMIAGGHITNQEVSTNAATLPSNANFETISKVLDSYKALAVSKAQMRMQQYEAGRQGQPAFPQLGNQGGGGHIIQIGDKRYQYNGSGDTADLKNYTEQR